MKYGSQSAKDAVAKREKRIERAADRRNQRLRDGLDKVLNRPLGSIVDLSKEDQIADWQYLRTEGFQDLVTKLQQRAEAVGPDRAKLELYEWDAQMAKLHEQTDTREWAAKLRELADDDY